MSTRTFDTPELDSGRQTKPLHDAHESGLLGKLKDMYRNYREWIRYRAAIQELARMDDARLADIGIPRGDIRNAVRRAAADSKNRERRGVTISG